MIEVRSRLNGCKLVTIEATAASDRLLRDVRWTIHNVRQDQSMLMHGRSLGQVVPDVDAHAITLPEVKFGSRNLAVECMGAYRDTR